MSEFTQDMEITIRPTLGGDDSADDKLPDVLAEAMNAADGDPNALLDWLDAADEEQKVAFSAAVIDLCSADDGTDIEAFQKRTGYHA